jgi:Asp-tRNA(Asn)/Glu-tRNA(Gln) amidotransferase A subunit family amidase
VVGRRLRPAPHGCRPASHPPFSRSYCRHPPTRCRSCRDSKRIWCFAAPFSVTGQPAISLPIGQTADGLPVGVQLVAELGREDLLLRVAAQLEIAAPWSDRRPPLT